MRDQLQVNAIQKRIYSLRGIQVMLDEDLAELYGVETRVLNQAVKRNSERFPSDFMFQLSESDHDILRSQLVTSSENSLRSQIVTLHKGRGQHRKYRPYAFTEQGVAMLSAVLRSETAVKVSIQIMSAFVSVDRVLDALEEKSVIPRQGIFYDGQVFDAWRFVSDLVRSAKASIILIGNYVDDSVLSLFSKRQKPVAVTILTKKISQQFEHAVQRFNAHYAPVMLKPVADSHDRFLIIHEKDVYHIGASLKDLGKKWFAFSKLDIASVAILDKLKKEGLA